MIKMTGGRPKSKRMALGEHEKDDETQQVYKNRILVHDIHRVRELSALLEERRRYFDGQLGQVYRNAGVSSPNNTALPRLRGMDSPPMSATPSDSNVTARSLMGTDNPTSHMEPSDVQSACSGRSYSIFADDECSVADAFEFTGDSSRNGGGGGRMGGRRSWNSSTMLTTATAGQAKKKFSKDTIHNEVMRTADLERKLKARRPSLPLALEASLKRPVNKKFVGNQVKGSGLKREKGAKLKNKGSEGNLSVIASTLLTKDTGYSSTDSEGKDDVGKGDRPRRFKLTTTDNNGGEKNRFSMTEILQETRKFDLSQDLKASTSLGADGFQNVNSLGIPGRPKKGSWDTEIMGVAPRLKSKSSVPHRSSTGSKSVSSNLAPNLIEYSPRSSLSTLSGTYPKIAFSSLEKMYREEGDKSKFQLHPSSLLLKPVPKIDMHLFSESSNNSEPDYSHDFRYLSLLDALVPCFEPANTWRPIKTKKNDDNFFNHNSPYRFQRDSGLSRMFPC